eukprot:12174844-Karenia_brevis.AAC.1
MTIAEMTELASLDMCQPSQVQGQEQHMCPEGHELKPGRPRQWGIRLIDQELSHVPEGLMSLGEMLHRA